MAENIATLALKTTFDGQELVQGFKRTEEDLAKFARNVKSSDNEMRTALRGLGDDLKERLQKAFASLQEGDLKGVIGQGTAAMVDMGKAAAEALGPIGKIAAGTAAAIGGIVTASRSVSSELNDLAKLSQRIGSTTTDTQVLVRAFTRAGVEGAEGTLQRLFSRLGELRSDLSGNTGQALRRLGLDPRQISQSSPLDAIRSITEALRGVGNVYDRATLSQQIFGKSFQEVQELIRRGAGAFDKASEQVRQFGDSAATIKAAEEAEKKWKRFGEFWGEMWDRNAVIARRAGVSISSVSADIANGITEMLDFSSGVRGRALNLLFGTGTFRAPQLDGGVPTIGGAPQTAAEAARRAALEATIASRSEIVDSLQRQADFQERISGSTRAERREAEALRSIEEQRRKLVDSGAGAGELERFDRNADRLAEQRREAERRSAREAIDDLRSSQFDRQFARGRAEQHGFIRPEATQAEVAAVADLIAAYNRFATAPGVTQDQVRAERDRLRQVADDRRQFAVAQQVESINEANRVRRMAEVEGLTNAQIQQRLALERGVSAERAAQLKVALNEQDALARMQQLQTPADRFAREFQAISNNASIDPAARTRLLGLQFQQLVSALGTGPGSFGLTGAGSRSREGLLQADDWRIRGQLANDPNRVPQLLEAAARQRQIQIENQQRDGRVLEEIRDGIGNLIEGF